MKIITKNFCVTILFNEQFINQKISLLGMHIKNFFLFTGMFQRIEKLRKNAFASMCVFGENNDNLIAGVWFWKGQDLPFPVIKFFLA
jgi:elongation factor 1-gamma